jgi:xanthine dehydrogenase FAD-binding subunit
VTAVFAVEEYFEAKSVAEALELLAEDHGRQVIAGGSDLLVEMRDRGPESVKLVSIRNIGPLQKIGQSEDGTITIGPLSTYHALVSHPLVLNNIPILAEASLTVGGPQLRHMATVGGNICNGVPSADSAPPLFTLNTLLRLQSKGEERLVPIEQFYLGPGRVDLHPGEMLTEILIRPGDFTGFGGCYIKFAQRRAMDLAIVGVAALCRLDENNLFDQVRISLGVAGPTPLRCKIAEAYATGKLSDEKTAAEIGVLALESAKARDSVRGSKEYREHLIVELTRRALLTAVARAGGAKNA